MCDEPSELCGLGPWIRIAFLSEHLGHILSVDKDIDHEAIIDSLAVCASEGVFCDARLVTQQVLLSCESHCP